MKTSIRTIIFTLLLTPVVINAQEVLNIEDCRERAIDYNKQLKKAALKQDETIEQKKAVRTEYLPSVSVDASYMFMSGMGTMETEGGFLPTAESAEAAQNGQFTGMSDVWMPGMSFDLNNMSVLYGGVSVNQPLYAGGKIISANKMADAGVEMAGMAYNLKYSEVIELTDKAFWNVAMVKANIDLANKYIEMLTETEDLMTAMYEVGLKPASEKLKVTVQKNEAELQLMIIENNLKLAKMNLNQVLGNDLEQPIIITYDSLNNIFLMDLSNGNSLAEKNRNELKLMEKQVLLAQLDKRMIQGDYLPKLGVGVQYNTFYLSEYREDFNFNPTFAAQLTIPVFSWGQGVKKKRAAQFRINQEEMELSRTRDLINLEVQQTEVKIREAYKAIYIAEYNIEAAEQNLDETRSSFEVGLNSTTDLLNAQATWLTSKAQRIQAIAKYKVLETTWMRVTGRLTPDN